MNPELRDQLTALHARLRETTTVDREMRELLVDLLGEITRVLHRSSLEPEQHRSLRGKLDALAVRFEAEHPALGGTVRQIVDALAKAGI
jgi:phytoene/squalene synthetase